MYFGGLVLVMTGVATLAFLKFWYAEPTCSDSLQNGDETGVDCGGSCQLVCSSVASKPVLRFDPRLFKIASSTYSALAFVDNYNTDSTAVLPYKFQVFNEKGGLIYEREGATLLPKKQTIAVFEGNIVIEDEVPKKIFFEMAPNLSWQKDLLSPPELAITHSPLLREATSPRVEASISNKSLEDLKNLELISVVFDGKDNPIAASRTFVERLKKGEKTNVFFTWPRPFDLGETVCEKPSDVVLAIDRSGSMQSLGTKPPEPLTSVKNAASIFVDLLKDRDSAALVSFGPEASFDSALLEDQKALKPSIANISIATSSTQFTNIADAITKSFQLIADSQKQKIIVLLTDGVATKPSNPQGSKSEAEDIAYAESVASKVAEEAKSAGVLLYTIGLGKDIHADFLRKIASTPESFLLAPATSTLESVYKQVSSSICKELPARIEVKYKILN
jgi:Mg-chelatase subunit ChlD